MQQKRQFHSKSRNGCLTCKKRHVKCDEQGPPCANCVSRKSACVYTNPPKPSRRAANTPPSSMTAYSSSSHINAYHTTTAATASPTPLTLSLGMLANAPPILPSFHTPKYEIPRRPANCIPPLKSGSDARRLLELDLMHRWTSSTYRAFAALDEDFAFLHDVLPRAALRFDFLLDGLMSVSALDIATRSGDGIDKTPYLHAALEYYDRSSSLFRERLPEITAETSHLFFMYSSFAIAANLMLPKLLPNAGGDGPMTALQNTRVLFHLATGCRQLVHLHGTAHMKWPLCMGKVRHAMCSDLPSPYLRDDEKEALARLRGINDRLHPRMPAHSFPADVDGLLHPDLRDSFPIFDDEGPPPAEAPRSTRQMYRRAIRLLEIYHGEDHKPEAIRGLCFSASSRLGPDFVAAMNRSEPFALLILMHWGALIQRHNGEIWWSRSLGTNLVEEIAPLLARTKLYMMQDVKEHVAWVQRELELVS